MIGTDIAKLSLWLISKVGLFSEYTPCSLEVREVIRYYTARGEYSCNKQGDIPGVNQ